MRMHVLRYHTCMYIYWSNSRIHYMREEKTDSFELKPFHWFDRPLRFELIIGKPKLKTVELTIPTSFFFFSCLIKMRPNISTII